MLLYLFEKQVFECLPSLVLAGGFVIETYDNFPMNLFTDLFKELLWRTIL